MWRVIYRLSKLVSSLYFCFLWFDVSVSIHALLHCCTAALLHCCTAALLHRCTAALLHRCTAALLHRCTAALLHCCTAQLVHQISFFPSTNLEEIVITTLTVHLMVGCNLMV